MPRKLTEKEIDSRLADKSIKRLTPYINMRAQHTFQCMKEACKRIWITDAHSILIQGKGCAGCYGNASLTNEDIDIKLFNKPIKRLDDYVNHQTHIKWQCLNTHCQHIWLAKPNHVLSGSGCPYCAPTKPLLSEHKIDEKLNGRNIQRIDNYQGINVKISFLCLRQQCNFIWQTTPNNVINHETGCPACCSGTNENLIDKMLSQNSFSFKREVPIKSIISNENRQIFVDFYIPNINTIIEYNGEQHYKPIRFGNISQKQAEEKLLRQQERDNYLQSLCITKNISLIWIDGRKYQKSKLEKYFLQKIIPNLGKSGILFDI